MHLCKVYWFSIKLVDNDFLELVVVRNLMIFNRIGGCAKFTDFQ